MFRSTAHVYDLIYEAQGKDYAAESAAVHDLVEARRPGCATLLDVACGTGGHLRHLQQWYEVVGADLDASMLAVARAHLGEVALVEADMRSMRLGRRFDAVVCLFSSVGYLRDAEELAAAMATISAHLVDGGVVVVDGWVRPDAWIDGAAPTVETAQNDEVKVVRVGRSHREGATTHLELHHLVATSDGVEYLVDHHQLTLFAPEDYEVAFASAGLTCEVVAGPLPGRDRYVATRA